MLKYVNRVLVANFFVVFLFLVDRVSKYIFIKNPDKEVFLFSYKKFELFFKYSENYNIAFGIKLHPGLLYPLIILIAAFLVILLIKNFRNHNFWGGFFTALILVGAIGNLIDRLTLGYVVDFIHFVIEGWPWPVFNVADICITIGVAGWFIKKM